jgi:hypothetical protein
MSIVSEELAANKRIIENSRAALETELNTSIPQGKSIVGALSMIKTG